MLKENYYSKKQEQFSIPIIKWHERDVQRNSPLCISSLGSLNYSSNSADPETSENKKQYINGSVMITPQNWSKVLIPMWTKHLKHEIIQNSGGKEGGGQEDLHL